VVFTKLAFTQRTNVQFQVFDFRFIVTVLGVTSTKMKGEFVRGISVAATSNDEPFRDCFRRGDQFSGELPTWAHCVNSCRAWVMQKSLGLRPETEFDRRRSDVGTPRTQKLPRFRMANFLKA
jgi:hypothetical protein